MNEKKLSEIEARCLEIKKGGSWTNMNPDVPLALIAEIKLLNASKKVYEAAAELQIAEIKRLRRELKNSSNRMKTVTPWLHDERQIALKKQIAFNSTLLGE